MIDINDCPFCYSVNAELCSPRKQWVHCPVCGASGPFADDPQKAIYLWNGALDHFTALRADCERLRKELDEATGVVR